MNRPLCHSFQELAAKTWQRLEQAEQTGMRWSEETNTETLLMTLHERHKDRVKVKAFSKHAEARNGADWEWWIGEPGCWLGMRVQAKRVEVGRATYKRLQEQRARGQPKTQIETLIDIAKTDRLNPVYCLYTFIHPWPTGILRSFSGVDGCLVAHASAVRRVGSNALFDLDRVAAPWHRLVCASASKTNQLARSSAAFEVLLESALAAYGDDAYGEDLPIFAPVDRLPEYMEWAESDGLVKRSRFDDQGALDAHLRERRLAGVVLIRTTGG